MLPSMVNSYFLPFKFSFVQLGGMLFENIDLSEGEYADYDEKGECPVMISNLCATFDVTK